MSVQSEQNAVKRWIPAGIAVDTRATKPDLTLLNETASKDILIRIVDVAVSYDDDGNLARAEELKVEKYEPVRKAIMERAATEEWGRGVDVQIVPLVVGVLGVVQHNWVHNMSKLLVPGDEAISLGKLVSCIAIKSSKWIWGKYNAAFFGDSH